MRLAGRQLECADIHGGELTHFLQVEDGIFGLIGVSEIKRQPWRHQRDSGRHRLAFITKLY